ncbi:CPBP family glutamic-type intramembrane protease [Bacillus cereus]|uniref:CPBP family glutamic-type intramembrane protease n=1 Tax=Bacillus cereus TaxID=1396 RepID=UPI0021121F1E|nr:CPBP family glutamic-type intramembrane protease [Bacillus cereus]MCQ6317115.1 CPBP family glutamic-type intramembrane protease [Bacillus cereus]MCQ6329063.1 CPBP family glutamic-type intramembrane protease [Bacillus cereus]MCQ6385207.1 CPBP family glutamic-type intramembrane protease [Bacillus cereus]
MTFIRDLVRPILFSVTFILLFILLVLADKLSGLGISNNNNAIESLYLFSILLAGIFIFPTIRKNFQNHFILHKNKIYLTIGFPILIGILMQFILNFIRFIPTFLGHDMIGIGSSQLTYTSDITETGFLFLASVIGPFNEEIIFRYSLYSGIFLVLADFKTKFLWIEKIYNELFKHKNPIYIWGWVVVTNIGFTLLHGPDISTFFLYFVPGTIYALFFLRLGFLSAWLAHGAFNLCSSTVLSILTMLFLN